jgi:hypothetical protein
MRRLFVGKEHTNAGFQQKAPQDGFVARSLTTHSKSGPQFSVHDEGQPDFFGEFDGFDNRYISPAQVGITIRVERQFHRHISLSIACCAANARSKAVSLRQVPAMSPRSRCRLCSPAMPAPGPGLQSLLRSSFCPAHAQPCEELRPRPPVHCGWYIACTRHRQCRHKMQAPAKPLCRAAQPTR